jgi:uncharacterized protein
MLVRAVLACLATLLLAGCAGLSGSEHPRRVPPDHTGSYTTWWSDERVREEGEYKQGRRHGQVTGYHPDGSLMFEGQFRDGLPVGQLVQHYPGGTRAIVDDVQPETQQTERSEYAPSGELRARGTITAGQRHGVVEQFHPNGQVSTRGRFEHDLPVGEWESWDDQGRLASRTVYWTSGGKAAGYLETAQDADGHVTVQTRILLQGEDMLGRVTLWYASGRQAGLVEYRNGLREGRDISWDEQGRKRCEGRRVADLREGVWTTWTETGAIESRTLFEHDRAIGPAPPGT